MIVIRNNGQKLSVKIGQLNVTMDMETAVTTDDPEIAAQFRGKGFEGITISERPTQKDEKPSLCVKSKDTGKESKEV